MNIPYCIMRIAAPWQIRYNIYAIILLSRKEVTMTLGHIIGAATCWFCALIFGGIALWAFKRKDPMHLSLFINGFTASTEIRHLQILAIASHDMSDETMS